MIKHCIAFSVLTPSETNYSTEHIILHSDLNSTMSLFAWLPKEIIVYHIFEKLEFPDKLNLSMSTPELRWLKPQFNSLVINNSDSTHMRYKIKLLDFEGSRRGESRRCVDQVSCARSYAQTYAQSWILY